MAFTYTADERAHLCALQEQAFMATVDGSYSDPEYWRHCAKYLAKYLDSKPRDYAWGYALSDAEFEMSQADCIEHAEALECGIQRGETI